MSEISKRIDAFLRISVDPTLKREGFKKDRRTYRRAVGSHVDVVQFTASSWNYGESGQFSVGLGVVVENVAKRLWGTPREIVMAKVKGGEAGCYTPLGWLFPKSENDKWVVHLGQDDPDEADRLRKAILAYALPWFSRAATEEGFLSTLEASPMMDAQFALALLYKDRGRNDQAESALQEILRRRPDLDWKIEEWREQTGV